MLSSCSSAEYLDIIHYDLNLIWVYQIFNFTDGQQKLLWDQTFL